ncbi:MAG TPA: hypothetical protein VEB20_22980 [Azospirillaceae bacterium]|nr:hypothetical protein [Azospirillaceae bacterium]
MNGAAPPAHGFPVYGRRERLADAAVHAAGLLLGPAAGLWLLGSLPEGATFGHGAALAAYVLASEHAAWSEAAPQWTQLAHLGVGLIVGFVAGTMSADLFI